MSSRPSTALLPNLRRLSYHDDEPSFRFIPLFIPTSLNYLQLHLMHDDTDEQPITSRDTLAYLPKKAMKLEHLVLAVWTAVKAETADKLQLNIVLPALPGLKIVEISPCLLTPSCLRALARLQGLQSLTIPRIEDRTQPSLNAIRSPDSFSCLRVLSIHSNPFRDVTLFLSSYKPRALRSISVSSHETEGMDSFTRLLDVIALAYPTVEDISLTSAEQKNAISSDKNFSVLRRCRNLTSLKLRHTPPLSLNVKIVTDLLQNLPLLRVLSLYESHGSLPTLPLIALSKIAPLCPHLEELGLYMDTRLPKETPPCQDSETFKRLKRLNVGASPLDSSVLEVTSFLSNIVPEGCRLIYDYVMPSERTRKPDAWKPVADFLPVMFRMRTAEKLNASCSCRIIK